MKMSFKLRGKKTDGSDDYDAAPHASSLQQELLVFGYRCKLYREDSTARAERNGLLLGPLRASVKTDRFDCRSQLLRPQILHALADAAKLESSDSDEIRYCEQPWLEVLDEERYAGLNRTEECSTFDELHVFCAGPVIVADQFDGAKTVQDTDNVQQLHKTYGAVPFLYDDVAASTVIGPSFPPYEKPPALALPPGITLPDTKNEHELIERTAAFISDRGLQFEIFLKTKQADNRAFGFLQSTHRLHPYYQHVFSQIKSGKYSVETIAPTSSTSTTGNAAAVPQRADSDSDDSDDGGYLHPSLFAGAVDNKAKPAMPEKPDSSRTSSAERPATLAKLEPPEKSDKPQPEIDDGNKSAFAQLIRRVKQAHEHVSAKFGLVEPQPPADMVPPPPDTQYIIDALAKHVAEHGDQFEQVVLVQYRNDPRFVFLYPAHYLNTYYKYKKLQMRYELERDRRQLQQDKLKELQAARVSDEKPVAEPNQLSTTDADDLLITSRGAAKVGGNSLKAIVTENVEPQMYAPLAGSKIAFTLPAASKPSTTKDKNTLESVSSSRRRDAFYCATYGAENYKTEESPTASLKSVVSTVDADATSADEQKARLAKARAFISSQRKQESGVLNSNKHRAVENSASEISDDAGKRDIAGEKTFVSAWAMHFKAETFDTADAQSSGTGKGGENVKDDAPDLIVSLQEFKQQMLEHQQLKTNEKRSNAEVNLDKPHAGDNGASQSNGDGLLVSLQSFRQQMLPEQKNKQRVHTDNLFLDPDGVDSDQKQRAVLVGNDTAANLIESLRDFRGCAKKLRQNKTIEKSSPVENCDGSTSRAVDVERNLSSVIDVFGNRKPPAAAKNAVPTNISISLPAHLPKQRDSIKSSPVSVVENRSLKKPHRTSVNKRDSDDDSRSSSSDERQFSKKRRKADRRTHRRSSSSTSSDDDRRKKRHRRHHRHRRSSSDSDDDGVGRPTRSRQVKNERRRSRSPSSRRRHVRALS